MLITLEAPEPISSRGHHVPMPGGSHSVLVNTALVEDGETRLRRDRMRASSSNTTADSYWHGHLHSAEAVARQQAPRQRAAAGKGERSARAE